MHVVAFAAELVPGVGTIRDFIERHREENVELLIKVLKEETRGLIERFDQLDSRHQAFLRGEFMPLVLDGLKKAEDARTAEHVRRLAAILANAAKAGPAFSADETADLMRLAIQLNEFDVRVLLHLRQFRPGVSGYAGDNPAPIVEDLNIMLDLEGTSAGTRDESTLSACLKLQSMGLVALDTAETPFAGVLKFRILIDISF